MAKKEKTFTKIKELKKKSIFDEKLGLDERDNIILNLLQQNQSISQIEIAQKIKLSQPSVGARIRKLQQKGILTTINGVNFKIVDLHLAKVDINATDTKGVLKEFKDCPFFVNGLITSGRFNLCLFFLATDLKHLEEIVNQNLRANPMVKEIEMNIVISTEKDFVLPINIGGECGCCKKKCNDCSEN
jgi:Lrp/AsnC family transcriptional regulator, leucine-responsive regulatory protein